MELIANFSPYIMLFLIVVASIATGIIFIQNKSTSNALLFAGFALHVFIFVFPLLFNISPMELNENNEAVKRMEGFLSFYQTILLELISFSFIALGFAINAYSIIKNLSSKST